MHTINLQFAKSISEIQLFSFKKIFIAIKYCFEIIKQLKLYKPDLVYFTISPTGTSFYRDSIYVLIIKAFHTKILFHLHGQGFKDSTSNNPFKLAISRYILKNSEVICLAEKLTEDLKDIFFGTPFIVPNGIKVFDKSILKNKTANNKLVQILYLSHLKENKGILLLIEALNILKENGLEFNAKLVGEPAGISVEYLQNYINANYLENNVEILGPLYETEKFKIYYDSDIFAFPTYFDAFPLVILEAMQCELPIITSDEGGISEIVVNGETGFVIERKNVNKLVEKLSILITDQGIREKMGINGKKRFLDNFTLSHFEKNMMTVFDKLLKD